MHPQTIDTQGPSCGHLRWSCMVFRLNSGLRPAQHLRCFSPYYFCVSHSEKKEKIGFPGGGEPIVLKSGSGMGLLIEWLGAYLSDFVGTVAAFHFEVALAAIVLNEVVAWAELRDFECWRESLASTSCADDRSPVDVAVSVLEHSECRLSEERLHIVEVAGIGDGSWNNILIVKILDESHLEVGHVAVLLSLYSLLSVSFIAAARSVDWHVLLFLLLLMN